MLIEGHTAVAVVLRLETGAVVPTVGRLEALTVPVRVMVVARMLA